MPTHRHKLDYENFPAQSGLTKQDYLIICGDFGGVWDGGAHDTQCLNWIQERSFTTLFIDGNHENHDMLDAMPAEQWNGGRVHFVREDIIHLMRGQMFELEGSRIFTMGGADSMDKPWREEGKNWWRREMPSADEYAEARESLQRCGYKVDYIVTHTAPYSMLKKTMYRGKDEIELNKFLDEVQETTAYKKWFFGHFHKDILRGKHRLIYDDVIALG